MRRNLSLYPFTVSAAAVVALIVSSAIAAAPAGTAPGKAHKPSVAAAPKRPKLPGQTVINDDLDIRLIVPDGWKPMHPAESPQLHETINSPVYYDAVTTQAVLTEQPRHFYEPPQFYIICKDLSQVTDVNQITPSEQDQMVKAMLENTNSQVANFRYEGRRHIEVDGEAATAVAAVATSNLSQEVVRFRIVSLFRNRRIYMFVFGAPVDDFPRFDPTFAKVLQNYHFLIPRKKNPTPLPPPADSPAPNPGNI